MERCSETPEHKAFIFLDEQGAEDSLSYREMHICASTIASAVRSIAEPGKRALLLCPTSSEFIAGFFGCLHAGVVPVPASPPSRRTHHRLLSMISDCDPSFVITTRKFSETFDSKLQTGTNSKNPETIFLDDLPRVEDFQPANASLDQLAFLQYTSGSTDLPKGVMVTHGNLWHNLCRIRSSFDAQEGSMSVSWLPLFHDMGLIGQMIGAVYTGVGSVLMQPSSFLRAPLSWVEVISKYRAFCAGGPNFAYDLCVQAALERQPQDLDLSHWKVAFSGAEPVRAGTLKRFAECFAPYGFNSDAFLPVYGLAESTLLVASGKRANRVKSMHLDPQELENNKAIAVDPQRSDARQIICCGTPDDSERIEIIDPDKLYGVAEGCIGEIWVSSPSIAAGYWGNPQASQETFMARLSTDPSRALEIHL